MPANLKGWEAIASELTRLERSIELNLPEQRNLTHDDAPEQFAFMLSEKSSWFVGMTRGVPNTITRTHVWIEENHPTHCYLYDETGLQPIELAACLDWIEGKGGHA
jgi:hypothetical protein